MILGPDTQLSEACRIDRTLPRCVAAGTTAIFNWASNLQGVLKSTNITVLEQWTQMGRTLYEIRNMNGTGAISVTMSQPIIELCGLFYYVLMDMEGAGDVQRFKHPAFQSGVDAPVFAPVVDVDCNSYDIERAWSGETVPIFPFVNKEVDRAMWTFDYPLDTTNFTWVGMGGEEASIGAVVQVPFTGEPPTS